MARVIYFLHAFLPKHVKWLGVTLPGRALSDIACCGTLKGIKSLPVRLLC